MNPIIILTGPVHTGKTTMLQHWVAQRDAVAGILTPVIEGDRFFFNIETGDSFAMNTSSNDEDLLQVGDFSFSKDSFNKASNILERAAGGSCSYLIIDEVGPLELNQHKGFYDILIYLISNLRDTCSLVLTVRENCIEDIGQLIKSKNKSVNIYSTAEFKTAFFLQQNHGQKIILNFLF